jgi:hypothetical protein
MVTAHPNRVVQIGSGTTRYGAIPTAGVSDPISPFAADGERILTIDDTRFIVTGSKETDR